MPEPTDPAKPKGPEESQNPPGEPSAPAASETPTGATPAPPTQPLPAAAPAPGATQGPPQGPPGGAPPGPPPGGPPPGGPGQGPPGATPPPRQPGLWRQATSTTGGTIAVIVAGCLIALLVLGLVGTAAAVAVRAATHDDRIEKVREGWDGNLPPGPQRKLDQLPNGPDVPGRGNGDELGPGGGLGPMMRGTMGLGDVQHGEFTVDRDGKAVVMTVQRGEVTKASDTSLTVKSSDNFSATYALSDDTRGKTNAVEVGDSVLVIAEKTGAKAVLVAATRHS
jgi:hypothetical protein